MKFAPRTLRRIEIALWIVGVCLIGGASGATWSRISYQEQQERALFGEPAVSVVTPAPLIGPPQPAAAAVDKVAAPETPARVKSTTATIIKKKPQAPDPNAIGRLEIPSVGVRAMVKIGTDDRTLARAVGLVPASSRPGQIGNTVLAGHRDSFFRPLRDIKVNDRIRLVSPAETFEYEVKSVFIVAPEDTAVLDSKGIEELTLVTCYPFRFVGTAPERFIVNAVRVN